MTMGVEREGVRSNGENGSPIDALVDVVQSSQEVVLRRVDVLRLDAERRVERLRDEAVSLVVAGLFAAIAWMLLLGAAVVFLAREIGFGWALLVLGVANVLLALLLRRGLRGERPDRPADEGDSA